MTDNLILRKGISFLLILTLIFSGFFVTPNQATAETQTITTIKTEEFDDLAYYDVWKHQDGTWQKGMKPGSSASQTYTITESQVPDGAKIISVMGEFDFGYSAKYFDFAVPTGSVSGVSYEIPNGQVKNGKYADLTYTVSTTLIANVGPYVLNEGWQAANVEGYRYYIPAHFEITYEITETVEIPEPPAPEKITAVIEAPASAKTGESFSVADGTLVGEETVLASSTLYKSVDGGTKQLVAEWEGTGNKGENTGGSISETYDVPCKIQYELIAETESGLTDTATKTVTINDGREISGQADLELDKYTYEGHPADAKDYSEFTVDGESYSAKRAYQEGIARNSYRVQGGTAKKDGYDAIVTFPNKGIYPVTLNVTVKATGERLTDTENIEVRKTPYVEGGLGGFQKQNRKQTLDFHIATYPDKPITDWHITIKDEKSGETAIIDSENPKFVGNSIKTREAQVIIEDKYWTTIRIEFLTKYPDYDQTGEAIRKFYYGIKVTDSKGDSDTESDYFDVAPDLPPVPQIGMQTTFLRNPGTNTAALEAEDISSSDGDQLQRSWYVADHNPLTGAMGAYAQAEAKNGYENLAFGTNQKIGWNKEGVGKETVKLHVKDVWIEPTLEEYITADDYLEAETTAQTEVINIAPVVSIEPLETLKANIALLVNKNNLDLYKNNYTAMQTELIQNGIDGEISFVPVTIESSSVERTQLEIPTNVETPASSDSKRIYIKEWNYTNEDYGIKAYYGRTLSLAWSYFPPTFTIDTRIKSMGVDNNEKYLVFIYTDKWNDSSITCKLGVLNCRNGQLMFTTTIGGKEEYDNHPDIKVFSDVNGRNIYIVSKVGIERLNTKTGEFKKIRNGELLKPQLISGKLGYIVCQKDSKYILEKFDLISEEIQKISFPTVNYSDNSLLRKNISSANWGIVDWSFDGKLLLSKRADNIGTTSKQVVFYILDSKTGKQGWGMESFNEETNVFMCKDKYGTCDYIGTYYGHKGTSQYYNDVVIYDVRNINDEEVPTIASWESGKVGSLHTASWGYFDRDNRVIHLIGSGFYSKEWEYSLDSNSWISTSRDSFLCRWSGDIQEHDDYYTNVYYGGDSLPWGYVLSNNDNPINISGDVSIKKNIIKAANLEDVKRNFVIDTTNKISKETIEFLEEIGAEIVNITDLIKDIGGNIKELMQNPNFVLRIKGDKTNIAGIEKNIELEPDEQYKYSYDMEVLSGTPKDLVNVIYSPKINATGKNYYKKVIFRADFKNNIDDFKNNAIVSGNTKNMTVRMDKDGYISFVQNENPFVQNESSVCRIDGKLASCSSDQYGSNGYKGTFAFLSKGIHEVELYHYNDDNEKESIATSVEIGYFEPSLNSFSKTAISTNNKNVTVSGTINPTNTLAYTVVQESAPLKVMNIVEMINNGYIVVDEWSDGYYKYADNNTTIKGVYTGRVSNKGRFVISWSGGFVPKAGNILVLHKDSGITVMPYKDYGYSFSYRTQYSSYPYERDIETDMYAVDIPEGLLGYKEGDLLAASKDKSVTGLAFQLKECDGKTFYMLDYKTNGTAVLQKCVMGSNSETTKLSIGTAGLDNIEALISNFEIKDSNGNVLENHKFNSSKSIEKGNWTVTNKGFGHTEMEKHVVKKEDETKMVYKKGQLVKYGINYSDYENDPQNKNKSYWLYTHTPFNDGENPQAAIIYDEDGNVVKICGKTVAEAASQAGISLEADENISIEKAVEAAVKLGGYTLTESIPRFYVDGKYTVYHYEYDDTSRGTVSGGYPLYDKSSNMADLTFYIEGSASAPWITGISTSPAKVKENEYFSINIGMDDLEKDVLSLTTEVYKDKKKIFTHRQKNIYPLDSNGNKAVNGILENGSIAAGEIKYPVINTGALPNKAQAGTYEVVCTVRDQTGAGLGYYSFTVVSEGKITGEVYHTEQWDINRKKYNVAKFGDEINKAYSYSDYLALKAPRKRGTNVFWSGEKFMLQAAVAGSPTKVTCKIYGTSYSTVMKDAGRKNAQGESIYNGSIWENSFINKWGSKKPEELVFVFTAYYSGGTSKTHECRVIVDNMDSYWKLHRVF